MAVPTIYDVVAADPRRRAVGCRWLAQRLQRLRQADLIIMSQQWWQTCHGLSMLGAKPANPEQKFRYFWMRR